MILVPLRYAFIVFGYGAVFGAARSFLGLGG